MSRHKRQRPTLADLSQPGPALSPADLASIVGLRREVIAAMCHAGEIVASRHFGSPHWKIHRSAAAEYCHKNRIQLPLLATGEPPARDRGWVYYLRCGRFVKIGVTSRLESRLKAFQTMIPFPVALLGSESFATYEEASARERELHRQFQADRSNGEWFRLSSSLLRHIKELDTKAA